MTPCTSINLFFDPAFRTPVTEQIRRCARAGFAHLDMNFWDWCHSDASPFAGDDWRDWVRSIAACARDTGVVFTQAHAHVHNFFVNGLGCVAEERLRRSVEGAGMLGIPWIVVHPSHNDGSEAELYERNAEYFYRHAKAAAEYGTGLAIENLSSARERFVSEDSLVRLIDMIRLPNVGACWDTGHGNVTGRGQREAILALGNRLRALHIADNNGRDDEHVPPFFGSIRWDEVTRALAEIGYGGDFTFEAHNFVRRLPECLKDEALALQYRIGETLAGSIGERSSL